MTSVAWREYHNHGASVPGPPVPGGCCHCQDHEDQENTDSQPPDLRTVQPAQVPCQSKSYNQLKFPVKESLTTSLSSLSK